jgi:tRNA(adenine34) deaminase
MAPKGPCMSLWESLDLPWQTCVAEAWAAYGAGSVPIGAAITDTQGAILARGRNRIFETTSAPHVLAGSRIAHAEMNALAALDHRVVDLANCTLYTTTEPCPMCTGALRMCHVGTMRYLIRDPVAGSLTLLQANPFMRARTCRVELFDHANLEAILNALYVDHVLRNGNPRIIASLDQLAVQCPRGVQLGHILFQQEFFLCSDTISAAEALEIAAQALVA